MPHQKTISLKRAFVFAWNNLVENIGEILAAALVSLGEILGLLIIGGLMMVMITPLRWAILGSLNAFRYGLFISHPFLVVISLIGSLLFMGFVLYLYPVRLMRVALDLYDRGHTLSGSWWPIHMLVLYLAPAFLVYVLSCVLGTFLFLFPGLYIWVTWGFFDYIIVDKKVNLVAAFTESARLTKGIKIKLLGFFLLCQLIMGIPMIGILLGVPFCILAKTYVYRQLQEQSH